MAQIRKMGCQVEIKSSADQFYDAFKNKLQLMPKIANQVISDVKLVQGDWASVSSVRFWTYNLAGKTMNLKEMREAVDDKNKTMTFKLIEGEILDAYKSMKSIIAVTPKGEGSLVNWTMEYEKQNENIPDPSDYKDFLASWIKNVDANLIKA